MRVVFAGTPEPAVPALRALLDSRHQVVGCLTRGDARSGRGQRKRPSPIKAAAEAAGVAVATPYRLDEPEVRVRLQEWAPQACAVVAYGALVPRELLELPEHGWINLHFSLLPAWRGAAPVQHALLAGDDITGAVTFRLEEGLDTGPVLGRLTETVRPRDTSGDLLERLAQAGAHLLTATLDGLDRDALVAEPQPAEGVTMAPKLDPAEARIRWDRPALTIDRLIRACTPAPGAWSIWRGERVRLLPVEPVDGDIGAVGPVLPTRPGHVVAGKKEVLVGTASTPVRLGQVQPHGKRPMPAADWARGVRVEAEERFDG